jgi:hypothetical protein
MGIPLWEPECGRGMPDWEGVRRVALPGAGSRLARRGWRKGVVILLSVTLGERLRMHWEVRSPKNYQ